MNISRILVPYDGSESSRRAFQFALDLAKKYGATLMVATCILEENAEPETMEPSQRYSQVSQKVAATELIDMAKFEAKEAGIKSDGLILKTPSIVEGLLSYAEDSKVELIVMGSRGLMGFKKLLLGSVASGIVQHAKSPVLIVK